MDRAWGDNDELRYLRGMKNACPVDESLAYNMHATNVSPLMQAHKLLSITHYQPVRI